MGRVVVRMSNESLRRLKWGDVAPQPDVDTTFNLTTAASIILNPSPNRVQVTAFNPTANTVILRWDEAPTTTAGDPVPANGGYLRYTYEMDGERIFGTLRGIASANSTIRVASDRMPAVRKVA